MTISRTFYFTLSFFLFFAPLPVNAIANEMREDIAHFEEEVIAQNPDTLYVDLSEKRSNIKDIILQFSDLDDQKNSPLRALNEHIQQGFSIAEYDAVLEALEYAASIPNNKDA